MTEDNQETELSEVQEQLVDQLPEMIKVFHFVNGQILVATVENFKGDYAMVYRPYTVQRTYSPEGELNGIDFGPYLSDLVDKDEIISLNLKNTITVTNPSLDLMRAYISGCLIIAEDDEEELSEEAYEEAIAEEHLIREEEKTEALQKKKVYH